MGEKLSIANKEQAFRNNEKEKRAATIAKDSKTKISFERQANESIPALASIKPTLHAVVKALLP